MTLHGTVPRVPEYTWAHTSFIYIYIYTYIYNYIYIYISRTAVSDPSTNQTVLTSILLKASMYFTQPVQHLCPPAARHACLGRGRQLPLAAGLLAVLGPRYFWACSVFRRGTTRMLCTVS